MSEALQLEVRQMNLKDQSLDRSKVAVLPYSRAMLLTTTTVVAIYVMSYVLFSRVGMHDSLSAPRGQSVWAFTGVRQRLDIYLRPNAKVTETERRLYALYYPLIAVDNWFGRIHVLSPHLPDIGG